MSERAPSNRRATVDKRLRVRALVRLILRRPKEPDGSAMQETVPTSLVVRGTVG